MLTYGFYSSLDGDRKYNANQMNGILDGIIGSGVFVDIGDSLKVIPSSGMIVHVGTGKAWFNKTWTENDSILPITLEESEVALDRIDAVVLEVNTNDSVRANSIKVVKGTPSSTPAKPTLTNTGNVYQHALAYITVKAGASSITSANIEVTVGTDECPYISSLSGDSLPIQNTPPTNPAIKAYIDTSVDETPGGGDFNDLFAWQAKNVVVNDLNTTNKKVVGAINELLNNPISVTLETLSSTVAASTVTTINNATTPTRSGYTLLFGTYIGMRGSYSTEEITQFVIGHNDNGVTYPDFFKVKSSKAQTLWLYIAYIWAKN